MRKRVAALTLLGVAVGGYAAAQQSAEPITTADTTFSSRTLECKPAAYQNWFSDCAKVFAAADVLVGSDTTGKLIFDYDGVSLRISAGMPFSYYRKFFTNSPPTLAVFHGERYVADDQFFNEHFPPLLRVGTLAVSLHWDGMPHWRVTEILTPQVVAALQNSASMELEYLSPMEGRDRRTVPILGFSTAVAALPNTLGSRTSEADADPIQIVARHLTANAYGVHAADLKVVRNPRGRGNFVYVPQSKYTGIKRVVWFVNNGAASALNSLLAELSG